MKYVKQLLTLSKRLIARAIDYLSFAFVILALVALSPWFFSDTSLLLFAALLPLLYAPIEALFVYLWRTTPGKSLLGLRISSKKGLHLSFTQSMFRSFSFAFSLYSLCIPLFNLYFLWKEIKQYALSGRFSWNVVASAFYKDRKFGLLPITLSLTTLIMGILPYSISKLEESIVERHTPEFTSIENAIFPSGAPIKWKDFASPGKEFLVKFPARPELITKDIPIKNDEPLDIQEYVCTPEENMTFSISHTKLPSSFLKWSPGLVLGGSLNLIAKHLAGAKVTSKNTTKFNNLPGLLYTMERGDVVLSGMLQLVDDTLYKVEVEYKKENEEKAKEIVPEFLGSFRPR